MPSIENQGSFIETEFMTMNAKKLNGDSNSSKFTWQQVAEQNHEKSAWVIFEGNVYDVTSILYVVQAYRTIL